MIFYTNMGNLSFKHTKLRKINSFLHLLKNAILHLSLFDRKATKCGFFQISSKPSTLNDVIKVIKVKNCCKIGKSFFIHLIWL